MDLSVVAPDGGAAPGFKINVSQPALIGRADKIQAAPVTSTRHAAKMDVLTGCAWRQHLSATADGNGYARTHKDTGPRLNGQAGSAADRERSDNVVRPARGGPDDRTAQRSRDVLAGQVVPDVDVRGGQGDIVAVE